MKKTTTLYLIWLCVLLPIGVWAQKIGYTNSTYIVGSLPETKVADDELKVFQNSLYNQLSSRTSDFQKRTEDYFTQRENGTIDAKESQRIEMELQNEQNELQKLDKDLTTQLGSQRESLYAPILEKVERAIDQVARENGYQLILDVSLLSILLYAEEASDITPLINAKLGI